MRNSTKAFCRAVAKEQAKDIPLKSPSEIYQILHPNAQFNTSQSAASRLMNLPEVKATIQEYLEQHFDTQERGKRLKQLIRAKKEHVTPTGHKISIKDNTTSLEALKLAFKLSGELKEGGTVVDNRSVTYSIQPGDAEKLLEIGRQLASLAPRGSDEEGRVLSDTETRDESGGGGGGSGEGTPP